MDFSEIAAVFAVVTPIILKGVEVLKFIRSKDINSTVTQLIVWVGGVGLLFLLSRTDFASSIAVGNGHLDQVSGATLWFIGLSGGSLASIVYDKLPTTSAPPSSYLHTN